MCPKNNFIYTYQNQKLTKFSEDTYFIVISLYKKFHVENHMRLSFQPQIQSDTTNLFETSPEILRLVSGVYCHVSKTLSIFFHSILA